MPAMIAALATAALACANPDTAEGQRKIAAGETPCEAKTVAPAPRPVRPAERARAIAAFDKVLKDGKSARWQFESVRGGYLICGQVNAKNSFGAYVGWTPFTVNTDGIGATTYDENRVWLFETLCHSRK